MVAICACVVFAVVALLAVLADWDVGLAVETDGALLVCKVVAVVLVKG